MIRNRLPRLVVYAAAVVVPASAQPSPDRPRACQPCHAAIADGYARTGMGRSFAPASAVTLDEFRAPTRFYHAPSARYYEMKLDGGGRPVQRRWQLDAQGRQVNLLELAVDFVIGSGNHSRTYAHRKPSGRLLQLPVSWYSEDGGHFAMSPGYDRPRHSDFTREIPDSCLFCHNGYPSPSGELAHGIDCARCHGDSAAHLAQPGRRGTIINPAALSPERQSEVCLQCHLESASRHLPDSIRRFDRPAFSYRPGTPLGDFQIYFDRAVPLTGAGFTVNHSAYGLRQSKCFIRSRGALTCTTCHDPHRPSRDEAAAARYSKACRSCHPSVHPERATGDCTGCHMPKRRTEDAVHVVMTDHLIQLNPVRPGLLAPIPESHGRYDGPVKLLYPASLPATPENRLYQAVAALTESATRGEHASALESLIRSAKPRLAGFDVALADALRRAGQPAAAERHYRRALELDPAASAARLALAELLIERGASADAVRLIDASASDPALLNVLAVAKTGLGDYASALAALERARQLDPLLPLTWLNLGVARQASGRRAEAAAAFREALRLDPDLTRALELLRAVPR